MTVQVKICGLQDAAAVVAAVDGGARYLGFVFCPGSRHVIDPALAASLIAPVPSSVLTVGLFVDPSDDDLERVLRLAPLRVIQLHGAENPERVAAIKKQTGLMVIKAVGIAARRDIETVRLYENIADILLLDAKPCSGGPTGGNGVVFDWSLLENVRFAQPWMLAGGLNASNIEAAVAATGARILDVSSGVEEEGGRKSPAKIKAFLEKALRIETSY